MKAKIIRRGCTVKIAMEHIDNPLPNLEFEFEGKLVKIDSRFFPTVPTDKSTIYIGSRNEDEGYFDDDYYEYKTIEDAKKAHAFLGRVYKEANKRIEVIK